MKEKWRPVVGCEEIYAVSDFGNVKRISRGRSTYIDRKLKPKVDSYGYFQVNLIEKNYLIHHLVAQAFIGKRPKNLEVNHKNGIKTDNRLLNLEYVTRGENIKHGHRNNLYPSFAGESNPNSKLKESDILKIREMAKNTNLRQIEIGKRFNVSQRMVSLIVRKENWKNI